MEGSSRELRLLSSRPVRWLAPTLYALALGTYMWREGIPVGRERLLLWLVLGLLALSTTNLVGWARGVVFEWLPLALVLAAYDLLRGQADELLFSAWYRPQLEADAFLFGGTVPTVWLQDRLWHGVADVRWYDYASWAVYVSYFVATYLLAALLWFFARDRFRRYVGCVVLLAGMAFTTFALFPAAPPWLASRAGEPRAHDAPDRPHLRRDPLPLALVRGAVRARLRVREPRRRGAVVARGVHAPVHALPLALGAPLGQAPAGRVPRRDGVRARLHGRALPQRHPARLDIHARGGLDRGAHRRPAQACLRGGGRARLSANSQLPLIAPLVAAATLVVPVRRECGSVANSGVFRREDRREVLSRRGV